MIARLLAGLLAAGVLAGCDTTKLEGDSVEKLIAGQLADDGHPGARVECPDAANEVGERFTCAIAGAPGLTKIDVRVARNERIALGKPR